MIVKQVGHVSKRASLLTGLHAPVANTAAVVTLAAPGVGKAHFVHQVQWSYIGAAPVNGRCYITVGGTTKWDVDIFAQGPDGFGMELPGTDNAEVVITLAAAGASCTGKLNVQYTTEATGAPEKTY